MKIMKKRISAIITAITIIFICGANMPLGAATAGLDPNVTVSVPRTISARVGREFSFMVTAGAQGAFDNITDMSLSVSYDSSALRLISGINSGNVAAGMPYAFRFYVTEEAREREYITFTLSYTYRVTKISSAGEPVDDFLTASKVQTVTVNISDVDTETAVSNIPPVIENFITPSEIMIEETFAMSIDVFNYGSEELSQAVLVFTDNNDNLIARHYIGFIPGGEVLKIDLPVPNGIKTVGDYIITAEFEYLDEDGRRHTLSKKAEMKVVEEEEEEKEAGYIRLQRIEHPLRTMLDEITSASVFITNSSNADIKDIQVSLYDDGGVLLTSDYIALAESKTITSATLDFPVLGKIGVRTYYFVIEYTDNDEAEHIINRSFSLIAEIEEEKEEEDPPEEPEKPSNVRIQSVTPPSQFYVGVRTDVPFKIINAGRGTAYNVEVYIVDASGREIAREYVGSILPSGVAEGKVALKFDDADTFNLELFAVAENGDETSSSTSRIFELKTIEYRVTITDVAGHEWVWNNMATIEFSVINGGTETMLNTSAVLADRNGNVFKDVYIGNIAPGEKRERVRFRDAYIYDVNADSGSFGFEEFDENYEYDGEFYNAGDSIMIEESANSRESDDLEFAELRVVRVESVDVAPGVSVGGGGGDGGLELFIIVTFENADMQEFTVSYSMMATLQSDSGWVEPPYYPGDNWVEEPTEGGFNMWLIAGIGGGVILLAGIIVTIVVVVKKKKKTTEDDDIDYFLNQLKNEKSSAPSSYSRENTEETEKEEITQ